MANICDNRFYFSCENNFPIWHDRIDNLINNYNIDNYMEGEIHYSYQNGEGLGSLEGDFTSAWVFPIELFRSLFEKNNAKKDGVYFRCVSEEYGEGYVAMNIYKDGCWRDEQCFDIV